MLKQPLTPLLRRVLELFSDHQDQDDQDDRPATH